MLTYTTNQFPCTDENTRLGSAASICDDTSVYGSLRKELAMATLKLRRGLWYARVRWYSSNGMEKEKQIPLRTVSVVIANERLTEVNRFETYIRDDLQFNFPWLSDEFATKIIRLTVKDAIDQWVDYRKKNKKREKTLQINQLSMRYLIDSIGANKPLDAIGNSDVDRFISYLDAKGDSDTTINIHLRSLKCMLKHFLKYGKIKSIPVIDQRKIPKTDPIYITDHEFQSIIELEWLDDYYKRIFLLYRETGMRLREPFMSNLNGAWIDIPPESKTHSARSIELSAPLQQSFLELKYWYEKGYGSTLVDAGDNISKKFKKALRYIGAKEISHFHSLRHTFAVRKLLQGTPIHEVKLLMGHASVTTTEQYTKMNLKRVAQDFPNLLSCNTKSPEISGKDGELRDTKMRDTVLLDNQYTHVLPQIAG